MQFNKTADIDERIFIADDYVQKYRDYFEDKVNINCNEKRCEENIVAKELEAIATYILQLRPNERCQEYRIFRDARLFALRTKEVQTKEMDIFLDVTNYKLDTKIAYENIDKNMPIIRDYNKMIEVCKNADKWTRFKFQKKLKGDIITSYLGLVKPIIFKRISLETTENNLDWFDFNDHKHVRALLFQAKSYNLSTWYGILCFCLGQLFYDSKPSQQRIRIYRLLPCTNQTQIAAMLNISISLVNQEANYIVKQIIKTYQTSLEDHKYTFAEKGVYKQCKICGAIDLLWRFPKDRLHKDGHTNHCRKCTTKLVYSYGNSCRRSL